MKKFLATMLALTMLCTMLTGCQNKKSSEKARDKGKESISSSDVVNNSDDKESSKENPKKDDENKVNNGEFVPGYRTEKEYTNESLGLKFKLNSKMVMASDEEISNQMQLGFDAIFEDTELGKQIKDISRINVVYDMMAVDTTNNSNVIIMAEKLPFSAITMSQYIASLKKQLSSTGMTSDYQDVNEQKLCGVTFSNLTYTMSYAGVEMTQTMLLKKIGDRMVAVSITYSQPEMFDEILKSFSKI